MEEPTFGPLTSKQVHNQDKSRRPRSPPRVDRSRSKKTYNRSKRSESWDPEYDEAWDNVCYYCGKHTELCYSCSRCIPCAVSARMCADYSCTGSRDESWD